MTRLPRLYTDLAEWMPLLSPAADHAEEAVSLVRILALPPASAPRTLFELGAGGGNLASHLKSQFTITLSDVASEMLRVSRELNPELEHTQGDMRSLRLGREFDVVLIHDAIMYCTTHEDLHDALLTASVHCRSGGHVVVMPDAVRETFTPSTESGGEDAPDGRGLRYLEWSFDPDPSDTTYETLYAIVLRDTNGDSRVELDRHIEGLFAEAEWLEAFQSVGLTPRVVIDNWNRHVFVGYKT
jgi:SAM-dependent methyltransferase